jgi:hypothetical protein
MSERVEPLTPEESHILGEIVGGRLHPDTEVREGRWFAIETAPRDGTEFLAYDETTGKMDVCVMEFFLGEWRADAVQSDGEYGPFPGDFGGDKIEADGTRTFSVIRYWQPLPAPPYALTHPE